MLKSWQANLSYELCKSIVEEQFEVNTSYVHSYLIKTLYDTSRNRGLVKITLHNIVQSVADLYYSNIEFSGTKKNEIEIQDDKNSNLPFLPENFDYKRVNIIYKQEKTNEEVDAGYYVLLSLSVSYNKKKKDLVLNFEYRRYNRHGLYQF